MLTTEVDEKIQQQVINAYHRVFTGPEWKIVRKDMEQRYTMNEPAAGFIAGGTCDPYRVVFKEGARSIMCHIDGMLSREPKGDANIEKGSNIKIIK